jgi:hypothetical protein
MHPEQSHKKAGPKSGLSVQATKGAWWCHSHGQKRFEINFPIYVGSGNIHQCSCMLLGLSLRLFACSGWVSDFTECIPFTKLCIMEYILQLQFSRQLQCSQCMVTMSPTKMSCGSDHQRSGACESRWLWCRRWFS